MRFRTSTPAASTPAPQPVTLDGWGIRADVPGHWEGRLFNRPAPSADYGDAPMTIAAAALSPRREGRRDRLEGRAHRTGAAPGELRPRQRARRLRVRRGRHDGAAARLRRAARVRPRARGTALFSPRGLPRPRQADFSPDCLQRRLPGQLGFQRFFTVGSRAMCLFVVLGSVGNARTLVADVSTTLDGVEVSP